MSFFHIRSPKFLLIILVIFFFLIAIQNVYAPPPPPPTEPTYTSSAHGNISYGVNRSGLSTFGYSIGNCAHCHEQHASIGGSEPQPNTGDGSGPNIYELFRLLFTDQDTMFCFSCHGTGDTPQQTLSAQYNYSRMAGGDTTISCPGNIREAFYYENNSCSCRNNCGIICGASSAHCLNTISNFLTGTTGQSWGFSSTKANNNPCSGCHNPHRAQRDPHTPFGRTDGSGYLVISSVSRPSQHTNNATWGLWGNSSTETMYQLASSKGKIYQAPCMYPWSSSCSSYEPDGSTAQDGKNMFDSVSFCLDCHKGTSANSLQVDWGTDATPGDTHGLNSNLDQPGCNCNYGDLIAPYSESLRKYYVLSCLDCHEPHGSPNEYLLREEVNGKHVGKFSQSTYWWEFCTACHTGIGGHTSSGTSCSGCHRHNFPLNGMCGCPSGFPKTL